MTFEEANRLREFDIVSEFGIDSANCICGNCKHYDECRAREIFEYYNPSDSISECDYHEEE